MVTYDTTEEGDSMAEIQVLDNGTIDKIAAGEVVERPASVVKELVENAIDAGATAVTVDIKQGGIALIRVTDNGIGIAKEQIRKAFLRHATSKIKSVEDLLSCSSLGFRGEALSSIAAVSMVEFVTKQNESLMGVRYLLEGAKEKEIEDIGAPNGTTVMVRNLFFNTPARRKFLKTHQTEASYISDLMENMAMSKPEISFKYVVNGQLKFHTSGNGDLKEIIYRIYGRDITKELLPIHFVKDSLTINGYIGKPTINRANRNFEKFFVNHRYIKSDVLCKSVEEAFKPYLMQHKFPFAILHIEISPDKIDVNVHPTKMEIRFSNQNELYQDILKVVGEGLSVQELIPEVTIDLSPHDRKSTDSPQIIIEHILTEEIDEENDSVAQIEKLKFYKSNINKMNYTQVQDIVPAIKHEKRTAPEPFEVNRLQADSVQETPIYTAKAKNQENLQDFLQKEPFSKVYGNEYVSIVPNNANINSNIIKPKDHIIVEKHTQLNFFDDKMLTKEARSEYKILGQIFDTYWLIAYSDKVFFMDQHAAHEKVKYEALLKKLKDKEITSQTLNPPVIVTLSSKEESIVKQFKESFEKLGFEIEGFGGNEYAVRSVPTDLYGCNEKELFQDILDELAENSMMNQPSVIVEKLASMSCKAAVKGNNSLTIEEVSELLDQLLDLDNPYNCPHGRPTIISMSKYEIEKKFKRII